LVLTVGLRMDTVRSAITEPVRRLEVFTGAGRRRKWSDEDKARIVAEIVGSDDSVCAVARRHGLSPQQLFGWRRQLREAAATHPEAEELQFVPAVVDAGASAPVLRRRRKAPRSESEPDVGMIEVEVEGVTIRAGRGADANTIAAIVQALKRAGDRANGCGSGDGGDEACRLPQGCRRIGDVGTRGDAGRSVLGHGLRVPGQTRRPDQADLLGWNGSVLVRETAGGRHLPWPRIEDGVMRLSAAQLSALLEGLDWRRVHEARETATPTQPG
jgi:transposase